MRHAWLVSSILVGLCLSGCGELADVENPIDESGGGYVVGGSVTAVCGFPMTAKIPGCTSTLLTPTILLTAKHCRPRAGMNVQFGEKTPYAFTIKATKCVSAPDSDAAYCVLPDDDRLKAIPTVPPLHGCEYTKFMKAGARMMGAGWGQTMGTGPSGTKNQGEVPIVRVADPLIATGDPKVDMCFGDSGGGGYIHLVEGGKDWGWRVIGTVTGTTRIPGGAACGGTSYTSVLRHIKLIEQMENIDITPCTDATGKWTPGAACTAFSTDISKGGGAWPACTPGPLTTMALDSCGDGPGPTIDGGAMPADAGRVDSGPSTGQDAGKDAGGTGGMIGPVDTGGTGGRSGEDAAPDTVTPPGPTPVADAGKTPPGAQPSNMPVGGEGCACRTTNGSKFGSTFLVVVALAFLTRRRRPR